MRVADFISMFSSVGENPVSEGCEGEVLPAEFWVERVGKPIDGKSNIVKGKYNDAYYMYADAEVAGWNVYCDDGKRINICITAWDY